MPNPDDLPIFRPKFGKRDRGRSGRGAPRFRNAVLALMRGSASSRPRTGRSGRARIGVRASGPESRRVVVKVHVAPQRAGGAKAAALHLRYIERDGVEKDGSPGVLYSAKGPVDHEAFGAPRRHEKHQFRIIVSPEDAAELDLDLYIRRFMSRVERDLGQRLEWAAVNHFDTEHPHAHIVVRGVDLDGREVRLPRAYVAHGLRDRAQELATDELGPRPEQDLRRQRERETTLERFTGLDRTIERRAVGTRIDLSGDRVDNAGRTTESLLLARLRQLEALRLADRLGPRTWHLTPGWQGQLRELGMRGDIIKQMHRALRGQVAHYEVLDPAQLAERALYGRVVKKGLSDELRGRYFAIVETPSGGACHLPLDPRAADTVREGDVVRIHARPDRRRRTEDVILQKLAESTGGVYDPGDLAKLANGEPRYGTISFFIDQTLKGQYRGDQAREPMRDFDQLAQRLTARLGALEKLGLAHPRNDGRWNVDRELISKLDVKDKEEPKARLVIDRERMPIGEQIRHPGQVWLDRLRAEDLAPFGFGVELRDAVASRAEVLRQRAIDPQSPERHRTLRVLERRTLEATIAQATGAELVRDVPSSFRGTVRIHESRSGGASYAEVTDGRRFVLVPATREIRAMEGTSVTMSRSEAGRIEVRPTDRDRGGT